MDDAKLGGRAAERLRERKAADLRFGSLFGTELAADYSVILMSLLIAAHLALGVLPNWHPDWGATRIWTLAVVASLLFLGSIMLHELSHAWVARRYGIAVPRITLFVFGGVAQIEKEPPSPKVEFAMAIVGPLVSLFIAATSLTIGALSLHALSLRSDMEFEIAFRTAGPVTTLLLWLVPVNFSLALFNLVPGFPLDGGRVLRSLLWALTGNLRTATRIASLIGQMFAWGLMSLPSVSEKLSPPEPRRAAHLKQGGEERRHRERVLGRVQTEDGAADAHAWRTDRHSAGSGGRHQSADPVALAA